MINKFIKKSIGCFIGGTLVQTDSPVNHGYKPIEEIKVGDKVLCMPELGGGEPAYKTVLNTFTFENKEIWYVRTAQLATYEERWSDNPHYEVLSTCELGVTPNHPFWLVGYTTRDGALENFKPIPQPRWVRADQIPQHGVVRGYFDDAETLNLVQIARPLSPMKDSKLAWLQGGDEELWEHRDEGDVYDLEKKRTLFSDFACVKFGKYNYEMREENDSYPVYRTTVYNIEVEDYHTYYVGSQGIWVHNINCGA